MGLGGSLPDEIIFDILARLPASVTTRFRAACRNWSKETATPEFVKSFNARKLSLPLTVFRNQEGLDRTYFVHYGDSSLESFNFLAGGERRRPINFDNRFHLHFSYDGLLLISLPSAGRFFICHPPTRRIRPLSGLTRSDVVALYSHNGGRDYRVLFSRRQPLTHSVLTIGSDEPHRTVQLPSGRRSSPAILFKGSVLWISSTTENCRIILFDMISESCREIRCPTTDISAKLFQFDDEVLGVSAQNVTDVMIWVAHGFENINWQLKHRLVLHSVTKMVSESYDHLVVSKACDVLVSAPGCLLHLDTQGTVISEFSCQGYDPIRLGHWFKETIVSQSLFHGKYEEEDCLNFFQGLEKANAASGAGVNDECITKFNELQAKRLHRFVTYKLQDSKEVVIDQIGERTATYEDFVSVLPENDCRYAVFDFDYMTPEEVPKSKIYYIFWSPDSAKVRSKMLYASSNSKFKTGLNGIQIEMQATDASEISLDAIQGRIKDRAQ